jgi:hypothetical protein
MAELKGTGSDGDKSEAERQEPEPKSEAEGVAPARVGDRNQGEGPEGPPSLGRLGTKELIALARELQRQARTLGDRDPKALLVLRGRLDAIKSVLDARARPSLSLRGSTTRPTGRSGRSGPSTRPSRLTRANLSHGRGAARSRTRSGARAWS